MASRQDSAPLDEILQLDAERRQKLLELEGLRHARKEAGRERKTTEEAVSEGRSLRVKIKVIEDEVKSLDAQLEDLLLQVPNMHHPTVPVGTVE